MHLSVAYRNRSAIVTGPAGLAVALAPNLRRDRVGFDATLRHPLRFREAISALHDVVISDLRYHPKDRTAHDAHLAGRKAREAAIRRDVSSGALRTIRGEARPALSEADFARLDRDFRRTRSQYWKARQAYSDHLMTHDRDLWRLLMPCDPVITVAPDVLFFECFSADESSYGCLTVDRDAFARERDVSMGTTNVDYSWTLYDHFQLLRTYRQTRFLVDLSGFEVETAEGEGYREEKIDLPPSWLRGFLQLQAAMSLPMRRVPLSREGLYNVLAFLKRHRAARSPRAVRFELEPGRPVALVLEPWEKRIVLHDRPYDGPKAETIRTWGRDRLRVLARLLPILDEAEVYLLGTGLPSFWSARMGEMRLLLGLSGWTANDWTGGSALAQLAPPIEAGRYQAMNLANRVAASFQVAPAQALADVVARSGATAPEAVACLNRLAGLGQVIHDLHAGLYRWRPVMPVALSAERVGPEDPETVAARGIAATRSVRVDKDETRPDGLRALEGQILNRPASLILDADGRMIRGKCTCSHHFTGGLRNGPCRHLQALRAEATAHAPPSTLEAWFAALPN